MQERNFHRNVEHAKKYAIEILRAMVSWFNFNFE